MRIAQLTYSVKPRGGVVHAIAVSEALTARGHHVELMAVGPPGARFFRAPAVPSHVVPHVPPDRPFDERIAACIETYGAGLRTLLDGFDVVHAQDCISANAALALRDAGVIDHVVRTVHHVDEFRSRSLVACQRRSIVEPDLVVCVSEPWIARVRAEFGVDAGLVRNGVDTGRFRPPRPGERAAARAAEGLDGRLAVLSIGGIEPRKGSLTLLEAFARVRDTLPERRPVLVVAGGATLFDYRDEIARFDDRRRELGLHDDVRVLGPVADERLVALYHAADVFALPSAKEGFGLVVLEALACGVPTVVSALDVFASFLEDGRHVLMAPVGDALALARAIARAATEPGIGGADVVARYGWDAAAAAYERAYARLLAAEAA
jgi:glycosyltransferase-like protein